MAGDVWSIGAIFAELLQMQRCNKPDPTRRGPIFPGDSSLPMCIPDEPVCYASRVDQMQVMIDIIGSPDESEIAKFTNEKARKYLRYLPKRKPKKLKRMFLGSDKHVTLDLLAKLLKFDVDKRITVDQALKHPYLKSVRGCVDREYGDNGELRDELKGYEERYLSKEIVRLWILREVLRYNPDERGRYFLCGALGQKQMDIVLCGFIRVHIEPFVGSIPMDVMNICLMYLWQLCPVRCDI